MKKLLVTLMLVLPAVCCFGQKSLISYDDIKYLLHNNLQRADTFLVAKGYVPAKKDNQNKNRKYSFTTPNGTFVNIDMRADGKRLFIEIETDEIGQYDLIRESIAQYLNKDTVAPGIQSYSVKDLGDIYIAINDTIPYNPLKRDYDIHVIGDKHITAYD